MVGLLRFDSSCQGKKCCGATRPSGQAGTRLDAERRSRNGPGAPLFCKLEADILLFSGFGSTLGSLWPHDPAGCGLPFFVRTIKELWDGREAILRGKHTPLLPESLANPPPLTPIKKSEKEWYKKVV